MEDSPSTLGVLKVKERSPNTCDEVEEEDEEVVVVVDDECVAVNADVFVAVAVFFEAAGDDEGEEVEVDFVVSLIVLVRTWELELDELLWAVKLLPGGRERVLLLSSESAKRQQRIS